VVNVDSMRGVKVDDKGSGKSDTVMTTAYTVSRRDNANLLTMTKNPLSMTPTDQRVGSVVRANDNGTMRSTAPSLKDSSKLIVPTRNPPPMTGLKDPPMNNPGLITAPMGPNADEPIVSLSQRKEAVTIWKNLLLKTRAYEPAMQKSAEMHDKNLRFLCNAMKGFRESKLRGMKRLQWDHGQFGPLQTAMHIPKTFVMPEQFFKDIRENERVAYNKRCCPLIDYYRQLCVDTPGYQSFIKAPMSISGDKDEKVEYRPQRSYHGFSQRPADDTWGDNVSSSARSVNPSALNRDQVDRTEDAEKRRRRPPRDAPIPGEDESSSEDDGHLYMDKMLPAHKLKLKSLTQDESRIRSGCVSKRYIERRDEALAAAEDDRLAGKPGPRYLAGIKGPWNTGHGTVLRNYDE
jgi:hypothetical protein